MQKSMVTSEKLMEKNSLKKSTSSQVDFHAKTSLLQVMEEVWRETEAVFFSISCPYPKKSSPRLYSLKMSSELGHGDWKELSENFPLEGMIVDGVLSPLPKRKLPIRGEDGSYWPTPTVTDSAKKPRPPRKKNKSGGQKPPLLSVIGGPLNPEWIEWLMGYKIGWTELSA